MDYQGYALRGEDIGRKVSFNRVIVDGRGCLVRVPRSGVNQSMDCPIIPGVGPISGELLFEPPHESDGIEIVLDE